MFDAEIDRVKLQITMVAVLDMGRRSNLVKEIYQSILLFPD